MLHKFFSYKKLLPKCTTVYLYHCLRSEEIMVSDPVSEQFLYQNIIHMKIYKHEI
jgi:hypothetical protein